MCCNSSWMISSFIFSGTETFSRRLYILAAWFPLSYWIRQLCKNTLFTMYRRWLYFIFCSNRSVSKAFSLSPINTIFSVGYIVVFFKIQNTFQKPWQCNLPLIIYLANFERTKVKAISEDEMEENQSPTKFSEILVIIFIKKLEWLQFTLIFKTFLL